MGLESEVRMSVLRWLVVIIVVVAVTSVAIYVLDPSPAPMAG